MGVQDQREVEATPPFKYKWSWKGGVISGLAASVVMGAVITVGDLSVMQDSIAGLYGFEGSLVAGWIAHIIHGTIFGIVFAAVLSDPGIYRVSEQEWKAVMSGIVYGLVLAVAGAGVIMPMWLSIVGFASPPPMPNITGALLVWHVVYGAVLGVVFGYIDSE